MYNFVMSAMYRHIYTFTSENISHDFLQDNYAVARFSNCDRIRPSEEILTNQLLFHTEVTNRFVFVKDSSLD